MTRIRIGPSLFVVPDDQWEHWVRRGLIPLDAWIQSSTWTQGAWRLADSMEVYHLYLPSRPAPPVPRAPGLGDTIFPRRGLSLTEILILANVLVTAALYLIWRDDYSPHLWAFSRRLRSIVGDGRGFPAVLIPVFLHANPKHIFFNMVALAASGAVVEYFYGKARMLAGYILCGLGGAALSLALRDKPVLSVGASGAIFGLYGISLFFLFRHLRVFGRRQRWKTVRVYLPIAVLALIPAIFGGDFYTHLGGFLVGCIFGIFVPAGGRLVYMLEHRLADEGEALPR